MPAHFSESERTAIYNTLLNNGYKLLEDFGMKKLKISDIAKSANIADGTFYLFFSSKYEFIYTLIKNRKEETVNEFKSLAERYPDGIPFKAAKQFFIDNLKHRNIYRLLTQADYNKLLGLFPQQLKNNDQTKTVGTYIMNHLKTKKGTKEFSQFSQAYKVIVMGTSDIKKLNIDLLDDTLETLVTAACKILY